MVKFEHPGLSFVVVVLHAPCLSKTKGSGHRPIDDIQTWWTETSTRVSKHVADALAWYLVDANAPLASTATDLFGMHHSEPMNAQGHVFEEFLHTHQLMVPSTFEAFHRGSSTTWTHSTGSTLRRDYILVSQAARSMVRSTTVLGGS